jgi:hypothetical protein
LESEGFATAAKDGSISPLPKGTKLLVLDKVKFKIAKILEKQYKVTEKE